MEFFANIYKNTDPDFYMNFLNMFGADTENGIWREWKKYYNKPIKSVYEINQRVWGIPIPYMFEDPEEKIKSWVDKYVLPASSTILGNTNTQSQKGSVETVRLPWSPMPSPQLNVWYNPLGVTRFGHILLLGDLPEKIILETGVFETDSSSGKAVSKARVTRHLFLACVGQYWMDRDVEVDYAEQSRLTLVKAYNKKIDDAYRGKTYDEKMAAEKRKIAITNKDIAYEKGSCVSLYVDWRYFLMNPMCITDWSDQTKDNPFSNINYIRGALRMTGVVGDAPMLMQAEHELSGFQQVVDEMYAGKYGCIADQIEMYYLMRGMFITGDPNPYRFFAAFSDTGVTYDGYRISSLTENENKAFRGRMLARPGEDDDCEDKKSTKKTVTDRVRCFRKDGKNYNLSKLNRDDNLPVGMKFKIGLVGHRYECICMKISENFFYVGYPKNYSGCYLKHVDFTGSGSDEYGYFERGDCMTCPDRDSCVWTSNTVISGLEAFYNTVGKEWNAFVKNNPVVNSAMIVTLTATNSYDTYLVNVEPGYYMRHVYYKEHRDQKCNRVKPDVEDSTYHDPHIGGEYRSKLLHAIGLGVHTDEYNTQITIFMDLVYTIVNNLSRGARNGGTVYNRGSGIPYSFHESLSRDIILDHTLSHLGTRCEGEYLMREFAQSVHKAFMLNVFSFPTSTSEEYTSNGHIIGRVVGNNYYHEPYKKVDGEYFDSYGNRISYPNPSYYDGTFSSTGHFTSYCVDIGFGKSSGTEQIISVTCPVQSGSDDVIDVDRLVILSRNRRTGQWEIIGAQCNEI